MARIPERVRWVFWDVDAARLDPERDAHYVLPRMGKPVRLAQAQRRALDRLSELHSVRGFAR